MPAKFYGHEIKFATLAVLVALNGCSGGGSDGGG